MKFLYVTTIGSTMGFFKDLISELICEGHTVDIATNETLSPVNDCYKEWGCKVYQISCTRTPLNMGTVNTIKEIKHIVSQNTYDIVHCHTPIAAMCTRFACRKFRKNGGKVFYTAHGFHFYKGAPLLNWMVYYGIEKICARFTDKLITINQEDYNRAKKHLHAKKVEYVSGVGLNLDDFRNVQVDKDAKRKELGIPQDAFLLFSAGEINKNKNQEVIIRALGKLKNPDIYYIIAGIGENSDYLSNLIDSLGLIDNVKLLGFRDDIKELCNVVDAFCFPSKREGLGKAALEAMTVGVPIITSNVHGINDYSIDGVTGFKAAPNDVDAFAENIKKMYDNPELRREMSENCKKAVEKFSTEKVIKRMREIYELNYQ